MRCTIKTAALFVIGIFIAANTNAQTILSNNISGTWTPSGNPYIISANATVPSGQSLTIQAGVIVFIGQGNSITVNGGIQAVGTSSQHITFEALNNTKYWNTISLHNGGTSIFNYCDFEYATNALDCVGTSIVGTSPNTSNEVNYCTFTDVVGTALAFNNQCGNQVLFSSFQNVSNGITMTVTNSNWVLNNNIANCSFINCNGYAVSGVSAGNGPYSATIFSTIQNCSFSSVGGGCNFSIGPQSGALNTGNAHVGFTNNSFNGVTNTAISLTANETAGIASATLANNIYANTSSTVVTQNPWQVVTVSAPLLLLSKAVSLQSYVLNIGSNYQVQASSDLINWTNQGSVFIATNSFWQSSNYWPVADWNQFFFRLVTQ